jgi:restriction endonuclease TaqI-like protein
MIVIKSSGDHAWPWADEGEEAERTFADTYPSLYAHLKRHEEKLRPREDQGRYWWELRACAYYAAFLKPKIIYQEIQFYASYAFDREAHLSNNKTFFITSEDLYLLAALNSPLMWWHNWRYLPHMKDEALSPMGYKMERLPIAEPSAASRDEIANAVNRLIAIHRDIHGARSSLADWYHHAHEIKKVSTNLLEPFTLDADQFVTEIKKALGRKANLSAAGVRAIKEEHARSIAPARGLLAEAGRLERKIGNLVNQAYGLTREEVQLMWATAPPRMPLSPPAAEA